MSQSQKKIEKNCMSHALNHGNNYSTTSKQFFIKEQTK